MKDKFKVINLWAGPGAGKSTTRAGLFHLMKLNGINCEETTEYAKGKTWEKNASALSDQLLILSKQRNALHKLEGQVEWVVTDAPLLLTLHYTPLEFFPEHFRGLAVELYNSYDNYNVFINRVKPYSQVGRSQSKEKAIKIDTQVRHIMINHSIYEPIFIEGNRAAPARIFNELFSSTNELEAVPTRRIER